MKQLTRYLPFFLLLPLLFAIGCGDTSSPIEALNQFSAVELEDVADDFSSALADSEEGILPMWLGDGSAEFTVLPGVKGETAPTISDTLIRQNRTLTMVRIRNFYDADGNRSDEYDPLTTVAMERLFTLNGERTTPNGFRTAAIDHHDSTWVDGMAPDSEVRTINGVGWRYTESSFVSRLRNVSSEMTSTYDYLANDIQVSVDRENSPYPLSGTFDVSVSVSRHSIRPHGEQDQTRSTSFIVTFDGSRYAMVTMADGTVFYIDLDEGRPHRIRP